MAKQLDNEYPFNESLTPDQIRKALSGDFDGFKYFFENCMVLQDRDTRQFVHPVMNKGQEMIARTILSYVDKETRATSHKECIILGPSTRFFSSEKRSFFSERCQRISALYFPPISSKVAETGQLSVNDMVISPIVSKRVVWYKIVHTCFFISAW